MTIKYKLKIDLVSRAAAQLNWELNKIKSEVSIVGARQINAKSLIGVLSGNFHKGDIVTISYSLPSDKENIAQIFNTIGEQYD